LGGDPGERGAREDRLLGSGLEPPGFDGGVPRQLLEACRDVV